MNILFRHFVQIPFENILISLHHKLVLITSDANALDSSFKFEPCNHGQLLAVHHGDLVIAANEIEIAGLYHDGGALRRHLRVDLVDLLVSNCVVQHDELAALLLVEYLALQLAHHQFE